MWLESSSGDGSIHHRIQVAKAQAAMMETILIRVDLPLPAPSRVWSGSIIHSSFEVFHVKSHFSTSTPFLSTITFSNSKMPTPTSGHILFIYVLSLLFSLVSAQDLSVPTSWRVSLAHYTVPKARHDVDLCTSLETEHFSTTF